MGAREALTLERRVPAGPRRAELHVRPRTVEDAEALAEWLQRNRAHLTPTQPLRIEAYWTVAGQRARLEAAAADVAAGGMLALLALEDGAIVAEVTISAIVRGPFRSARIGYAVDARRLRCGIGTATVTAASDIASVDLELHRLQAATLLGNEASQGVLRACGFQRIGVARKYLAIAGEWRDHALWQRLFDQPVPPPSSG